MDLTDADCEAGIRAVIAVMAMHAMISSPAPVNLDDLPSLCCSLADKMMAELEKGKT